jgi:hypothetical protein
MLDSSHHITLILSVGMGLLPIFGFWGRVPHFLILGPGALPLCCGEDVDILVRIFSVISSYIIIFYGILLPKNFNLQNTRTSHVDTIGVYLIHRRLRDDLCTVHVMKNDHNALQ